jgi:hypothetical protein
MSNGSEHIPDRDYKTLVARGNEYANQIADSTHLQHKGAELVGDLADAVEALQAENESLNRQVNDLILDRHEVSCDLSHVRAERDALQSRLDAMTVEWSAPDTGNFSLTEPFPIGYGTNEALAKQTASILHGPVYKRLVGPWVVVKEEDASRLGVPAAPASETGFDLELGEDGQ